MRNTWAPVRKASRGPFVSRLGGGLAPALRGCLTSAAHFREPLALACARRVSTRFRFVGDADQRAAWQRSTLDPHRDLAPVRSFGLARWRHSISSPRLIQRTPYPRRLPLANQEQIPAAPWSGAPLTLRQVQHSKYRARARSVPGPYAGSLMSEMGHQRTCLQVSVMSVLPLILLQNDFERSATKF